MHRLTRTGYMQSHRGGVRPSWPFRTNLDSPQARGLIYWWPLTNEHTRGGVEMVRGQWATPVSDADYQQTQSAEFGVVLVVDDENEPLNAGLQSLALTEGSLSIWARHNTGASVINESAFSRNTSGDNAGDIGFVMRETTDVLSFFIQTGLGTTAIDADAAGDTEWHNLVGTWSSAEVAFYLDGVKKTGTGRTLAAHGSRGFAIGRANNNPTIPNDGIQWNGHLTDARIYDRKLDDATVWQMFDPRTRWDLYDSPRQRTYFFEGPPDIRLIPSQFVHPEEPLFLMEW